MARFKGLMAKSVLVFLFLSLTATPLAALWATDLGASPASAAPGGHKGRGGNSTGPSCKGDSHVVVKPVEGIDDVYLNDEYGTETVRKFYGTDIWVLEAPDKKGAKNIVKDMLKSNDIIWAESGQFSNSEVTPNMVSAADLDLFTQAMLDQFTAASLDQFSAAMLDQFSTAMLDQFTQATLDQFSASSLDQFTSAALDQFTHAT
ncbi:MAG: hypothetical protein QF878_17060, partial [SAR202 cluster bacterium]|nr:hypothetical protein [SAR202 cluster bacterium]